MKKLYIIRHAKSSWKDTALDDFKRPLSKRGRKDAPFMAKKLKQKGVMPDVIISSPATRAKTTAELIAKELNFKKLIINLIIKQTSGGLIKIININYIIKK